jgi:hypothetical protein
LSLKKRPPLKSSKTELTSATTTKKISGTCWKAGTGTSRIAKPRERRLLKGILAETADHPAVARIEDLAGIDLVAAETGIVDAMPIDHHALVKLKQHPLRLRPVQNQPKVVRHDVKNVLAPTDHLVNVPNRVLRAAKIAVNADHVGLIVPLLPLPQKQQMSFHRESMTLLSPVQQPNGQSEPNESSDHGRQLSRAADPLQHLEKQPKTLMNS